MNGSVAQPIHGKTLRCAVNKDSPHIAFWDEALRVLESMKLLKGDGTQSVAPSIKNWILTIKGLKYLWQKLSQEGFEFLSVRNFNQDPLENFFGCIRSHGVRNVNPTCMQFRQSFAALLVNNLFSVHSPSANCEADDSGGALDTLARLLDEEKEVSVVQDVPRLELVHTA